MSYIWCMQTLNAIIRLFINSTEKIWNLDTDICLNTLVEQSHPVYSIALTRIVSRSYDGIITIWNAQSGLCLKTLKGHSSAKITYCKFS